MILASKEARQSLYLLRLLEASGLARNVEVGDHLGSAEGLARMLTSIVKTASTTPTGLPADHLSELADEALAEYHRGDTQPLDPQSPRSCMQLNFLPCDPGETSLKQGARPMTTRDLTSIHDAAPTSSVLDVLLERMKEVCESACGRRLEQLGARTIWKGSAW